MKYYFTKEGLEKLKKEFQELKNVKRKEVIERIATAREMGDLSENAEYQDARDEQGFIEGRILELENIINKAEIIIENNQINFIQLGSTFIVDCDGIQKQYTIVGSNEAKPSSGLISNESPLGGAFLDKKVGDKVEVDVPKGKVMCAILKILKRE